MTNTTAISVSIPAGWGFMPDRKRPEPYVPTSRPIRACEMANGKPVYLKDWILAMLRSPMTPSDVARYTPWWPRHTVQTTMSNLARKGLLIRVRQVRGRSGKLQWEYITA